MKKLYALIVLSSVCASISFAANIASDSAADPAYNKPYPQWVTGDNGGFGFGSWTLSTTNNGGFYTGGSTNNGFIPSGGIDSVNASNQAVAWGMWADTNAGPPEIVAYRGFTGGSLGVGQTFEIYMDTGWNDGVEGFVLRTGNDTTGKNTGQRFEFLHIGGQPSYAVFGQSFSNTVVGWTDGGVKVDFTLTGADSYSITVTGLTSGVSQTITGTLAGTAGAGIDSVALYDENSHSGIPNYDLYFNRMSIAGASPSDFVITAITRAGSDINLVWNGLPGSNVVQVSTGAVDGGFTTNFVDLATNILATAGSTNYTHVGGASVTSQYYRILLKQP